MSDSVRLCHFPLYDLHDTADFDRCGCQVSTLAGKYWWKFNNVTFRNQGCFAHGIDCFHTTLGVYFRSFSSEASYSQEKKLISNKIMILFDIFQCRCNVQRGFVLTLGSFIFCSQHLQWHLQVTIDIMVNLNPNYLYFRKSNATKRESVNAFRIFVLLLGILSSVLAASTSTIYGLWVLAGDLGYVLVFPQFLVATHFQVINYLIKDNYTFTYL